MKRILLLFLGLFFIVGIKAQITTNKKANTSSVHPLLKPPPVGGGGTISGSTTVTYGQSYNYSFPYAYPNITWSTSNGMISSSTNTSATVTWGSGGSGGGGIIVDARENKDYQIKYALGGPNISTPFYSYTNSTQSITGLISVYSNGTFEASLAVTINIPSINAGSISPSTQTIAYNTSPATLSCGVATGGNGNSFTYQWQSSSDEYTWQNITGATGTSYSPNTLQNNTYYRVEVSQSGQVAYTDAAIVDVTLQPGTLNPSSKTITYNTGSGTLTCSASQGGNANHIYQWQVSMDNMNWSNISGATSLSYTSGGLTNMTFYRLQVDGQKYSNTSIIYITGAPINDPPLPSDFTMPSVADGASTSSSGNSNIVGSISGSGNVSLAGSATYTMPVDLPPGTNGMQPSVAVSYNSMAQDGLLGWGWTLNALSTITRVGKNTYYNGTTTPVNYTNTNDAFMLDGQRLMVTSSSATNGADGTIYGTENESFSQIVSHGGSNTSGPSYFTVTTKDGKVLEYGNTTDSKMLTDNGQSNMLWLLDKVTDQNGNYMTYHYTVDNIMRAYRLIEIDYTGNTSMGIQPYNKVLFTYSIKQNYYAKYIGGASFASAYVLSDISVQDQTGSTQRTYSFTYSHNSINNNYYLTSATETGSDGKALNPTTFTYGNGSIANTVQHNGPFNLQPGNNQQDYFLDFDGDGRKDLMNVKYYFDNNDVEYDTSVEVLSNFDQNQIGGGATLLYSASLPKGKPATIQGISNASYGFLYSDYDGDGADDILQTRTHLATFSGYKPLQSLDSILLTSIHRVRDNPGTQAPLFNTNLPANPTDNLGNSFIYFPIDKNSNPLQCILSGDFDGDGSTDYILMLGQFVTPGQPKTGIYYEAFFNSPTKSIYNQEILGFNLEGNYNYNFTATSIATADKITPIDLNGDGKSELLVTKGDTSYVVTVNPVSSTSGYSYMGSVIYKTAAIGINNTYYVGDFNGDKNQDLLVRGSDGKTNPNATWNIYYGTGASTGNLLSNPVPFYFAKPVALWGDNDDDQSPTNYISQIQITDMDGDGVNEISSYYDLAVNTSPILTVADIARVRGSSIFHEYDTIPNEDDLGFSGIRTVQDFDGDGKTDIFQDIGGTIDLFYINPFSTPNLLAQTTNGFGTTTSFNYKSLSDVRNGYFGVYQQSGYNNADPSLNFPFNTIDAPLFVVSSITAPNGIGGTNSISYSYKDAIIHRSGKDLLGFKGITTTNTTMGTTSNVYNSINTQYAVPYPTQQTTNLTSTGQQLSEQDITTNLVSTSTGGYFDMRFLPQTTKSVSINYLTGTATETDNTYDNYGNITTSIAKGGSWNGSSVSAIETATTTTTLGAHNTPVPALPDKVVVQNQRSGQPSVSKETDFNYDAKGNISSKTEFAGLTNAITTTYVYDGYGNGIQATISASGISSRVSTSTYDVQGRFVLKNTQPGSGITKTQSSTYDTWGNPLTAVSTDGLTTTYTYDGLGRNTKTVLPDGQTQMDELSWGTGGNTLYIDYKYAPGGGHPDVKTAYDLLGREIALETTGFNNQLLTQTTSYDAKGNTVSQVAPYYPNESPQTTTTQYDTYNRVTKITDPSTFTTTSYTNLGDGQFQTTVTNAAGQASSKTQDGSGKTITANDNGGQLNYTYDSWGNQLSAGVGNTVMVSSVYDAYGRQSSMTDKNAGTITYQYDALGELTQQKDALNHVYNMVYDDFGRLTSKTGPEGTTAYTYYSNGNNNNNNPVSITGPSGDVTTYDYDNLSRKISQTTTIDGTNYTDQLQYNSLSQIIKTTYASGIAINDSYDNNGIPLQTSLQDGTRQTTILFTATGMNSRGIYTGYTLGNGHSSQVVYDLTQGVPTRYYTPGIQDLNMVWDASKGNLNSRNDAIKGLTETFSYDNLNRLTASSVNNVQQFSMTYDNSSGTSLGNIATKSDAGNYTYLNDKINAVAYITNPVGANVPPSVISTNTQQIGYTPFLKVDSINQNGFLLKYTYGADQGRIKSILSQNGNIIETKYYLSDYEKQIRGDTTRYIHYIVAGNGLAAIAVVQNGVANIYYAYTDHLGSILTLTDSTGNVVAQQNFDAWGRYRNPNDWTYNNVPSNPTWLYRGYTGHEHLPQFALINMNGRVYDPVQGRMLSPDNNITYPGNTQGYNRYAYGLNNPLLFTDPTGNNFGNVMADVGAFVGLGGIGYIGASLISNGHVFTGVSHWSSNWWKGSLTAYLIAGSIAVPFLSPAVTIAGTTATVGDGLTIVLTQPVILTGSAAFAANVGISAGLASVISGAATGVLSAASTTTLSTIAANKPFNTESFMNQLFASTVTGAITGALGPEINSGMNGIEKGFTATRIGKIVTGGVKGVVNGIISDEVKDVDKEGWSGLWDASIYNNGSNINSDMLTNFAKGAFNLSNFSSKASGTYPFSSNRYNYMRGLYPKIFMSIASTAWSGMTTIKAVNGKFEYAPNENGFNFNSLIKSVPPIFYKPFFSGGQGIKR